jgi:hypothetical protein
MAARVLQGAAVRPERAEVGIVSERAKWERIPGGHLLTLSGPVNAFVSEGGPNGIRVRLMDRQAAWSERFPDPGTAKRYAEDELRRILTEALERLPEGICG